VTVIVRKPTLCDVCGHIVIAGKCTNSRCGAKATPPPQEPTRREPDEE
jgi:hypothetical protein